MFFSCLHRSILGETQELKWSSAIFAAGGIWQHSAADSCGGLQAGAQDPVAAGAGGLQLVWNVLGRFWLHLKMNRGTEVHVFVQLEGFGSTPLLTATEERKLGRKIQALLALEAKRDEAMERLGRDSFTTAEWMAEAGVTDAKEYKKILKVRSPSARIGSAS